MNPFFAWAFGLTLFVGLLVYQKVWNRILKTHGGDWTFPTRIWGIGEGNILRFHRKRERFVYERGICMSDKTLKKLLVLDACYWCHCSLFMFVFIVETMNQILKVAL